MKRSRVVLSLFAWCLICAGSAGNSHADSAEVLPKGVFRTSVTGNFYLPVTKMFNENGGDEDLATDFNARLDSLVFESLSLVEKGFGLPAGSASIGNSVVSFEDQFYDLITEIQYGITDRLSVGIKIPYLWNKNTVKARLDTTTATVGLNPFFGSPFDPFRGAPIVPRAFGGIPFTAEQVRALLGPGLDINKDGKIDIPGFGYKRFDTWSESDVGDLEAGLRYQYFSSDKWRLAFTGGVRFPTGPTDDPDNLVDIGFGTGAWALLFRSNNDYVGIKNLILNATVKYDLYLPDSLRKRVPSDVFHPITTNQEVVDRTVGSHFEFEGSGTYQFPHGFSLELLYRYAFKFRDHVSGNGGFNYSSLEDLTDWTYHLFKTELCYSTFELFKAKRFPLPMTATFGYNNVFAGTNRYLNQQFFSLSLAVYF